MFRLFVTASFLLVSVNAVAGENAFNADMENPTISAAISEFEQVCFPFIAHETELTAEQDRAVFQSRMVEAGYEFGDEKTSKERTGITSYSPRICKEGSFPPVMSKIEGDYTVFPASKRVNSSGHILMPKNYFTVHNGDKSQKIESRTMIVGPRCETLTTIRGVVRTSLYTQQRYESPMKSISAYLTWQETSNPTNQIKTALKNSPAYSYDELKVRTSFPPASSCEIHAGVAGLSADIVENAIVQSDPDWKKRDVLDSETKEPIPGAHSWSQCTKQDEENYAYKASLIDGSFSVFVKSLQDDEQASEYGCEVPEG